jgi:hypothetical protein
LYSFYLLYWYQRTNTDAKKACCSIYLLYWYQSANTDARRRAVTAVSTPPSFSPTPATPATQQCLQQRLLQGTVASVVGVGEKEAAACNSASCRALSPPTAPLSFSPTSPSSRGKCGKCGKDVDCGEGSRVCGEKGGVSRSGGDGGGISGTKVVVLIGDSSRHSVYAFTSAQVQILTLYWYKSTNTDTWRL